MTRFAARLEFGDKTEAVKRDALRLVSRMNRDWIQTGRRPAGICAACLLIAARMHNFKRTQREIVQVVNICDATLRKRLEEFKSTPSAAMSVNDFQNIWLDEQADPPSFQHGKKRKEAEAASTTLPFESGVVEGDVEQDMEQALETAELLAQKANMVAAASRATENPEDEDDLTALDDDEEIQSALLERDEVEFKTVIWTHENKDWLAAQEGGFSGQGKMKWRLDQSNLRFLNSRKTQARRSRPRGRHRTQTATPKAPEASCYGCP